MPIKNQIKKAAHRTIVLRKYDARQLNNSMVSQEWCLMFDNGYPRKKMYESVVNIFFHMISFTEIFRIT